MRKLDLEKLEEILDDFYQDNRGMRQKCHEILDVVSTCKEDGKDLSENFAGIIIMIVELHTMSPDDRRLDDVVKRTGDRVHMLVDQNDVYNPDDDSGESL